MPLTRQYFWLMTITAATIVGCRAGDETAPVPRDPPAGTRTVGQPTIGSLMAGSGGAAMHPSSRIRPTRSLSV